MIRPLAVLFLLASAAPAAAQVQLPAHVGGRVIEEGPVARFGWPGVYFEGHFSGTEVTVAVESATEHFRVLVDGRERALIVQPGTARLTIAGLAPGEHVIRVEKTTESQQGGGRFLGFWAERALPPRPRARRIEFIGDSYTVGYGNASHGRTCTEQEVHDLTDTSRAFGPLAAARLDADYRMIAYSGFGIARNYAGGAPELSLPAIYDRAIPGEPGAATAEDGWRPQLIVIALGTNDFSTPLGPGERWADQRALSADYRARYVDFVRRLSARQPQARFLLLAHERFASDVEQVAAALNGGGPSIVTLRYGELERTGCNWHPSLADHRALAELVLDAVARMDGLRER